MNKWSLRLGKIAGIDFIIHWSFLLFLGVMAVWQLAGGAAPTQVLLYLVLLAAVFFCVALHELGHALAARYFGIGTRDITLLPIGGLARLERMPDRPYQEFIVAIAGPAVNVVIAGVLLAVLIVSGGVEQALQVSLFGQTIPALLGQLMLINVALVLFNMLPAFPMDGGRVLRSVLAMFTSHDKATLVAARVGQVFAVGFALLAVFQPVLLLIAAFVFFAAQAELRQSQVGAALKGASVGNAMATRFLTLSPYDSIRRAAETLWTSTQPDFPIMDGERLLGLVHRDELWHALHGYERDYLLMDIMRRDFSVISDNAPLESAASRFQQENVSTLVVLRMGQFVGLLTPECLRRYAAVREFAQPQVAA